MSREIKFRAWDKEEKIMINADSLAFEEYAPISLLFADAQRTFEVMQYTGLRDKNGRDIYEGDILKRTLLPSVRLSSISIVKWIPAKACLSSADMDGRNVTFISDYINSNYELEVIGNICENPELLKGGAK